MVQALMLIRDNEVKMVSRQNGNDFMICALYFR